MRTQLSVYLAQHNDTAPGYTNGDTSGTPTYENFVSQMTGKTDESGAAGTRYGPYLSFMPSNPFNSKDTIKMLATGDAFEADNSYGWLYKPSTNEFRAANPGTGSDDKAFVSY